MNVEEIIRYDVENNNPESTLEEAYAIYNTYADVGRAYKVNNTIFLIKKIDTDVIYFHTINADGFKQFISNFNIFFSSIDSNVYSKAVTYFNNRKLKCFFYKPYTTVNEVTDTSLGFKYEGVINIKEFHGMG